jgi:hypothetical protein
MYWRALKDVPIELLEEAAVELAATAKFFPKPAEWRQAVDELLDRRERLREIAGPNGQPLLPGEIGEYHCEDCDNSGWVTEVKVCEGNCGSHLVAKAGHTHAFASPCTNKFCLAARQQKTQRKRRYAKTRGE